MEGISRALVLTVFCTCLAHCLSNQGDDLSNFYKSRQRIKRQAGVGGDACMQIYTVPRQLVKCEPTDEVRNELVDLRELIQGNQGEVQELEEKLDLLDPDKPRELPQEVKDRLATIDSVKQSQAGHAEFLKRLEEQIAAVKEHVEAVENSDRTDMARLMEQQTRLIQLTMNQSNASLHTEYTSRLDAATQQLRSRLQQLELDLRTELHRAEEQLEDEVKKTGEESRESAALLRTTLTENLDQMQERMGRETSARLRFQNLTEGNQRELSRVQEALNSVREHQVVYDDNERALRGRLENLEAKLVAETEEKMKLREQTDKLRNSLEVLESGFAELRLELGACRNRSGALRDDVRALRAALQDKQHLMPRTLKVGDCQDALSYFHPVSGVYSISPPPLTQPFDVFCDMDGQRGWTVIQRRQDGSVDFFRGWQHYKDGFGDVQEEFWLGLTKIRALTSRKSYRLRIDLRDWDDTWYYAEYSHFHVDTEENHYALHVSGYEGTAGDSLRYHQGMPFSTMDRNNDANAGICATWCHGAWWYKDCFHSNLNGRYYNKGPYVTKTGWGDGVVWRHLQGTNFYSLKAVVMKIRPNVAGGADGMQGDAPAAPVPAAQGVAEETFPEKQGYKHN